MGTNDDAMKELWVALNEQLDGVQREIVERAAKQFSRPSVWLRPKLMRLRFSPEYECVFLGVDDGFRRYDDVERTCWCAEYGDVKAYGLTPLLAFEEFDWLCTREPGFERG